MRKDLGEKKASGMTVNERLYHAGLLNDFDQDVLENNKPKLESILEKIHFSQKNIQFIVGQLLK